MTKEYIYFLNYGEGTLGKDVFDSVIKKHFKNNVKDVYLKKAQALLRTHVWFFTIVSNDGWTMDCSCERLLDRINVDKLTAPDGSVFMLEITFKNFSIFHPIPRWIRKQYRSIFKKYKPSAYTECEEFVGAANKLNKLNNMSEEEMVKQAVVKDDPKPDEKLKKPLEKLIEKEAADKENGN